MASSVDAVLDDGDLQVLEALLNETRRVLSSRSFDEAVRAAAAQTSRSVTSGASATAYANDDGDGETRSVALVKLTPAVSGAASMALEQPGDVISVVGVLPEVMGLCHGIYDNCML